MQKKTAFITGAAGGLGSSLCVLLAEKGWQVFAADINMQALHSLAENKHITPVALDVTDADSVAAAAQVVGAECDGLDAVVNYAGIVEVGSIAEIADEVLQRVLQINVMGMFRVNKALLPLLDKRKGRIVNISSETGWQTAAPFNAPYAMSKHAVEAYSDSLRRELMFHDIAVIKVQPGPFKTGMVAALGNKFDAAIAHSQRFKPHLQKIKELAMQEQGKAHDPALLSAAIYTALTTSKPKAAYSVKADAGRAFLNRLPTGMADWLLKKVLKP